MEFLPKGPAQRTCSYRCSKFGPRNPNWTGGKRTRERGWREFDKWRDAVFARDNYACIICQARGGRLVPHHKDGFHWCAERRADLTNGVTLCMSCHHEFHRRYGTHRNTEAQWIEWAADRPAAVADGDEAAA